jgi:serine protease AprX
VDGDLDAARGLDAASLRQVVATKMRAAGLISEHYKHVDGTSFASPIVASLAARILEANPALAPHQVKALLVRTARRLPEVEPDRQGWGMVEAEAAVSQASRERRQAARAPAHGERRKIAKK